MKRVFLAALVVACGCDGNSESAWVVSVGACGPSPAPPRTLVIDGAGTAEIIVQGDTAPRLLAHASDRKTALKLELPASAQGAVRYRDGVVVVGDGTPPDGSAPNPYVAFVDTAGKPRWVTPLWTTSTGVSTQLSLGVHENTIVVAFRTTDGTSSGTRAGVIVTDPGGTITGRESIAGAEGAPQLAFDRDGFVVGALGSLSAFNFLAKPRYQQALSAKLDSLANCGDGVIASVTTTEKALLRRFGPDGSELPSIAAPTAGAVVACDSQGIVASGVMSGVLADNRFNPVGTQGQPGAYIATFSLEGEPRSMRQFGSVQTVISAVAVFDQWIYVTGTFHDSIPVESSLALTCEGAAQDIYVARVRR